MKYFLLPILLVLAITGLTQEHPPPLEEEPMVDIIEETPLILAIKSKNLSQVKTLVAAGADVNGINHNFNSPLKIAIETGNVDIVKCLITAGAKDDTGLNFAVRTDNIKMTQYLVEQKFYIGEAIVYATENDNLEMVELLASNGAKVDFSQKRRKNIFKKYFVSPIDVAITNNNLDIVNVLVKNGVPIERALLSALDRSRNDIILELSNDLNDKSWLLIEAFERENNPVVKELITRGVSQNSEDKNGNSILFIAASKGKLESVQKCIEEYKVDLFKKNDLDETALMKAAKGGSRPICDYLLKKGLQIDDQNRRGETVLFYALTSQSRNAFDFLVAKGADIKHKSQNGNTLLIEAAIQDEKSAMIHLLSLGADVNHINNASKTAFYHVVSNTTGYERGETDLQNAFLQAGADINTREISGKTILFKIIETGNFNRVSELVSKGADPNTKEREGKRPSYSEPELIKFLIESGADINARDKSDNTFLCVAVKENDIELASFLIEKGIDVNKRCHFDEQSIIKAVENENLGMIQILVENGADVNAKAKGRKNVLDYAEKQDNAEVISYLRSRGAITKEERNEQYKISLKLESQIKIALIAEDLESVHSLMLQQENIVLQEKVIQNIAFVASKKGDIQLINKLLSDNNGFTIDSPVNDSDQTVLFIASIYAQNKLIIDLLAKGSNVNHLDKDGKTASDFASKKSTQKIFKNWSEK